jgi:hypothetical protein
MEFLCPSCQKMLTVPEQFAGQPMKCPLCGNAFQAPSLAPPPTAPSSAPMAETHTYAIASDPELPPPPKSPPPQPKEAKPEKPNAPTPMPSSSSPATPTPPGEYGRKFTLQLKPQWLPYIPAGALIIVFFLTFFSWVGAYPNGLPIYTQNAWQAAFNSVSSDYDSEMLQGEKPGPSIITLFWILIFLALLVVAIGVLVAPRLGVKLPPAIKRHWDSRMIVICGAGLFLLFLMIVLDLARFPLEDKLSNWMKDKQVKALPDKDKKGYEVQTAIAISSLGLQHTNSFRLVFFLLLITVVCALLEYWMERRGPSKSLPRVDILW